MAKPVPYINMYFASGTFYPQWESCKLNQFDQEYGQLHSIYETKIQPNNRYGNWIPSIEKPYKRPIIIRDDFNQLARFFTNTYDDENVGTVFGWRQYFHDTPQHGWI